MKLEVTRDVVSDLWPLCRAGEASRDSRDLVDAFLAADPGFADTLNRSAGLSPVLPGVRLSPEGERQLLDQARNRARIKLALIGGAILLVSAIAVMSLIFLMFVMSSG